MNREIKFRAWDKEKKRMIEVQEMYFNYENRWVVCGEIVDLDAPIMQYTGLKDNNGKEIYEGDIVWAYYIPVEDGKWYSYPMVIEWEEGSFISKGRKTSVWGSMSSSVFDVIGNIYENPELLEDK